MSNEREAIARLQQGDIGGLETLVQLYQTAALHVAYIISRDRTLAEDIVQAAFLRAYERIQQFDTARSFRPWFLRSVVNATLRACARNGRQFSLDAYSDEYIALPSDDPSLDEMLIAAASDEAVWTAMSQLAPAQRAVVVMRYYLDMSEAEMAQTLDCPPGTIKRRLYDARQRLRRLLPAWVGHPLEE